MKAHEKILPEGFRSPTVLPADCEQQRLWQEVNRMWWESHPMRYDWRKTIPYDEFGKEFFQEIDERFFEQIKLFMPWREIPFDTLIDFPSLGTKDVLEIGVGSGVHAQLLARYAKSYTGIDITEYAVRCTSRRMRCFGLEGRVLRADAEQMGFSDESFDFVWSWGVLHHSASTAKTIQEVRRVLRPKGEAVVMVYHRGLWNYYLLGGILTVLRGRLPWGEALHVAVQQQADGGLARFYSISDWRQLVTQALRVVEVRVFGEKSGLVPMPGGRLKGACLRLIPNRLGRFLTNDCGMGSLLVSRLVKD